MESLLGLEDVLRKTQRRYLQPVSLIRERTNGRMSEQDKDAFDAVGIAQDGIVGNILTS